MADVHAIFGTLLALGIAFPGMLVAFWLLFPQMTTRTKERIDQSAPKSLAVGLGTALALAIPIVILLALPFGLAKFLGVGSLLVSLAFAGLGAAGVAGAMGAVLQSRTGQGMSAAGAFVLGAIALELAAAFPIIGWFLLLPLILLISLGASVQAAFGSRHSVESNSADLVGELAHEPQSA